MREPAERDALGKNSQRLSNPLLRRRTWYLTGFFAGFMVLISRDWAHHQLPQQDMPDVHCRTSWPMRLTVRAFAPT